MSGNVYMEIKDKTKTSILTSFSEIYKNNWLTVYTQYEGLPY